MTTRAPGRKDATTSALFRPRETSAWVMRKGVPRLDRRPPINTPAPVGSTPTTNASRRASVAPRAHDAHAHAGGSTATTEGSFGASFGDTTVSGWPTLETNLPSRVRQRGLAQVGHPHAPARGPARYSGRGARDQVAELAPRRRAQERSPRRGRFPLEHDSTRDVVVAVRRTATAPRTPREFRHEKPRGGRAVLPAKRDGGAHRHHRADGVETTFPRGRRRGAAASAGSAIGIAGFRRVRVQNLERRHLHRAAAARTKPRGGDDATTERARVGKAEARDARPPCGVLESEKTLGDVVGGRKSKATDQRERDHGRVAKRGRGTGRPERPKRSKHPGSDPRLSWARFASTEGSSDRKGRRRSRVADASSSSASSRGFWTRLGFGTTGFVGRTRTRRCARVVRWGRWTRPGGARGAAGWVRRRAGSARAWRVSSRRDRRTNEVPRFEEAFSSSEGSSGRRRRSSCVVDANHRTSASARAPMGGRRQRMVERAASRCRRGRGSWSWSVRSREGRTCERFAVKHGRRVSRRPVRGVVRIEASHRDGASSGSRRPSAGCACRDGAAEGVPSFKVCRLSQRKSARASSPMTDANIFLVISSIQLCSASRHHEPGWARAVSSAPSAWARLVSWRA